MTNIWYWVYEYEMSKRNEDCEEWNYDYWSTTMSLSDDAMTNPISNIWNTEW